MHLNTHRADSLECWTTGEDIRWWRQQSDAESIARDKSVNPIHGHECNNLAFYSNIILSTSERNSTAVLASAFV